KLPPWLKNEQPWWVQQHVLALVKRKLLAAEAEKRGMGGAVPLAAPDRERLLASALLDTQARSESEVNPAKAQRAAWTRFTGQLLAAAEVRFDDAQMFQIEPRKLAGALPGIEAENGVPQRLEFIAATGRCLIE